MHTAKRKNKNKNLCILHTVLKQLFTNMGTVQDREENIITPSTYSSTMYGPK